MNSDVGSSSYLSTDSVQVDSIAYVDEATTESASKLCLKQKPAALETILLQSLNESNMVVCVKDINKLVLKQNDACKTLCGDREGEACLIGCMEVYDADTNQQWHSWGNRTYKNCYLHNNYYNVTILCSEQHLTTILQPLDNQHAKAIEYYQGIGLSKRELEVISSAVTGSSNIDICEELNISKATLRTHLNKVYTKVSEAGGSLLHLPEKRSSAGNKCF